MSTIKIVLRTSKINTAGLAPLALRITKNRKTQFIFLDYRIRPDQWDEGESRVKKSNPNSTYLNNYLAHKFSEAQQQSLNSEVQDKYVAPAKIKEAIMGKGSESFIKFFERYLKELEHEEKFGTLHKCNSLIRKLKTYLNNKDLTFAEINVSWLRNYESYLRTELNNCTNTVHANLKVMRKLMNDAVREEIIPFDRNPFLRYKLKWQQTTKAYLTEDEIKSVENLHLEPGSKKDIHRDMYIFSCYAGGLRISDVVQLKWENFNGEKIIVSTQKTSSVVAILLPTKAKEILAKYRKEDCKQSHYIFPMLDNNLDTTDKKQMFYEITSLNSYTNNDLKDIAKLAGIDKHIHFHTSRHTFATRALLKGMRIEYVSKLLGHSNIKTTQIYTKIVSEELDKAMAVFD